MKIYPPGGENITDAIFLRNYLIDQGYDIPPVTVYQDNQAAIRLMENGFTSSSRTRHIDIRYFFIKDRIENGDVRIEYLHTKQMIADFLTKPLVGELFYRLRDLLLGYATLWEGCAILLSPWYVFQYFAGNIFGQNILGTNSLSANWSA